MQGAVETISGDRCTVKLADGSVIDALPVNVTKPGDRTLVSIRPERIEFHDDRMPADTHKLEAEVLEFIYMGDSFRTRLRVADNDDFIMKSRNAVDQRRLAPGREDRDRLARRRLPGARQPPEGCAARPGPRIAAEVTDWVDDLGRTE